MTCHGMFYYLFLLVKINLSGLPFERKCCCFFNYNSVTMIDDLTYYTLSVQTQTRSNSKRQKERKLNKKKTMKFRDLWRLTFAATETRGRNFIKILKYGD